MIVHTALEAARAMLHALGKGPGHWGEVKVVFKDGEPTVVSMGETLLPEALAEMTIPDVESP